MRKKRGLIKERSRKRGNVSKDECSLSFSEPLFEEVRITTEESIISIMAYLQDFPGTTKAGLARILNLVQLHMAKGVSPRHVQSLYKFCKEKKV